MPRLPLCLAAFLLLAAPARAEWTVAEMPVEEDGASALAAETYSASGEARLAVGCTAEDVLYVGIEYVGHATTADQLRVAYRVNGGGSIQGRWPTSPAMGSLRVYNTIPVYVDEMVRRLRRGSRMTVDIELLPRLAFDLAGSDDAITRVMQRCGGETPSTVLDPDETEPDGTGRDESEGGNGPPSPGEPTPLVPSN
jgi:hypothetical protein